MSEQVLEPQACPAPVPSATCGAVPRAPELRGNGSADWGTVHVMTIQNAQEDWVDPEAPLASQRCYRVVAAP